MFVRIGAAFAALVLAAAIAFVWLAGSRNDERTAIAGIGGPFALVDQHGRHVTERNYLGKPMLVFFGFTHCPDVCPTTLLELTNLIKELGPDAGRLNVLFITVDPERDTPQQLSLYLSSFDPRITGLSGSPAAVAAVMKEYRAIARKVPLTDGGYTMDHTATIYMMNAAGQLAGMMSYQDTQAAMRAKLKRLLDSS